MMETQAVAVATRAVGANHLKLIPFTELTIVNYQSLRVFLYNKM